MNKIYLRVNEYGRRKAEKFRSRFRLEKFVGPFKEYGDVHDYLHTVCGALPVWNDEKKVLELEEKILLRKIPIPRGLEVFRSSHRKCN